MFDPEAGSKSSSTASPTASNNDHCTSINQQQKHQQLHKKQSHKYRRREELLPLQQSMPTSSSKNVASINILPSISNILRNNFRKLASTTQQSTSTSTTACSLHTSHNNGNNLPSSIKMSLTTAPILVATNSSSPSSSMKAKSKNFLPKLIHPSLLIIPMQIRFCISGLIGSTVFMIVYNYSAYYLAKYIPVYRLYAICYFLYIPLQHYMISLFVFGWPENYLLSLINNFPIGLTGMILGSGLTAYLEQAKIISKIADVIKNYNYINIRVLLQATVTSGAAATIQEEKPTVGNYSAFPTPNLTSSTASDSEFYISIVVLIVTSIWQYVLSLLVNTTDTTSQKKEL